jgi:rRNA-processing protein FCF1
VALNPSLVDTNVWVDHLKAPIALLHRLETLGLAYLHEDCIVEFSLGQFRSQSDRHDKLKRVLRAGTVLKRLSTPIMLAMVGSMGMSRVGAVDAQLMFYGHYNGMNIWTGDQRLQRAARRYGVPLIGGPLYGAPEGT